MRKKEEKQTNKKREKQRKREKNKERKKERKKAGKEFRKGVQSQILSLRWIKIRVQQSSKTLLVETLTLFLTFPFLNY